MNNTEDLRIQVKNYIDTADDATVKEILNMLEGKKSEDWWDELPEQAQEEIDNALKELDEGKGLSYEQVKQLHPRWFKK
jgi:thiamine pyrophosphate-dependent acetolactate synthase large subunit-like protein